jgi:hypothetical protein
MRSREVKNMMTSYLATANGQGVKKNIVNVIKLGLLALLTALA